MYKALRFHVSPHLVSTEHTWTQKNSCWSLTLWTIYLFFVFCYSSIMDVEKMSRQKTVEAVALMRIVCKQGFFLGIVRIECVYGSPILSYDLLIGDWNLVNALGLFTLLTQRVFTWMMRSFCHFLNFSNCPPRSEVCLWTMFQTKVAFSAPRAWCSPRVCICYYVASKAQVSAVIHLI